MTSDSTLFKPASVWTLAWPSIVANLCHALVNLSHIKIIGALGTAAVAAVTTNQRFFFFLMALLMGLSTATTATVARSWGARQPAAAASYTWNAVWIAVLLTAAISLVAFAFPQLLVTPFHLEPQAADYAAILIRWISAFNVVFVVGFGFSIAGATLVGQYIGAKQPQMARKCGWRATGLAVATMTGIAVLIAFWAEPIARFLVDDDEVVARTVLFIYILAAVHPLIGIELTLAGALRGAGDTRFPLFSSLCGLIFGRIGLAWLFVSLDLSVVWVYCSLVGEYSIKASLIVWRYHSGAWLK